MATAPFYTDGTFTTAAATSPTRLSQPFAGDAGEYLLEQDFMQFRANFTPTALNTAHPDFSSYKLVNESQLHDLPGGIVTWTRFYASLPDTRNDFTSIAYNFIGFYGKTADIAVATTFPITGRLRFSQTVPCRVKNDYFLTGTGGSFATPDLIPTALAQRYYVPLGTIAGSVFTPTYAPGSADDIRYGRPTDFIYNASEWAALIPTRPSVTEYQTLINTPTEIIAEDSTLSRWLGNYYVRVTKYIYPQ